MNYPPFSPAGRTAALVLSLSVLLTMPGCSGAASADAAGPAPAAAESTADSSAISVQVTYASYGSVSRDTEFAGKLEAAETVKVYAPAQAQVTKTYYNVGEHVEQGALLFELDTEDLESNVETTYLQYQTALNSADNSVLNAQKSWNSSAKSYQTAKDNLEDLQDKYDDDLDDLRAAKNAALEALNDAKEDLAEAKEHNDNLAEGEQAIDLGPLEDAVESKQLLYSTAVTTFQTTANEYDRQEETYKTQKSNARDDMEYARQSYELVKGNGETGASGSIDYSVKQSQLSYENAVKKLEEAKVTAPVSGTVVSKAVSDSDMATLQTAAYVIQTEGEQVVTFNLSEDAANALTIGSSVTVVYNGSEFTATIVELSNQASETTGLYSAKARPTQSLGTSRTGSAVKVKASTAKADGALLLPLDLIDYDEDQPYVYVYRDGVAVRADLETGVSTRDTIVITSGLTEGDAVITTWHPDLKDGAKVSCPALDPSGEAAADPAGEDDIPADGAADAPAADPTDGTSAPEKEEQ